MPAPSCPRTLSLVPVDDAAPREVVGRKLHEHAVPGQDTNEMLAHLARDVRQHAVLVLQLHLEHGVGEGVDHRGLHLDGLFLHHGRGSPGSSPRTLGPASVTATEYSKWAERLPSLVRAVQPSSAESSTSAPPALPMGSMARPLPG